MNNRKLTDTEGRPVRAEEPRRSSEGLRHRFAYDQLGRLSQKQLQPARTENKKKRNGEIPRSDSTREKKERRQGTFT